MHILLKVWAKYKGGYNQILSA